MPAATTRQWNAAEEGCDCVQIFTKNNNQWRAKPLTDEDVRLFTEAMASLGIAHPISHDSYLINLGSPDKALWKKSVDALVVEIERASRLEIPYVVAHPGAFTSSSEAAGIKQIARGINEVHRQTKKLQPRFSWRQPPDRDRTWAGSSSSSVRFRKVKNPDSVGICFDTCHVHAAGYPMETEKEYRATMRKLNRAVGVKKVKAFHLNDSKTTRLPGRPSRRDRQGLFGP